MVHRYLDTQYLNIFNTLDAHTYHIYNIHTYMHGNIMNIFCTTTLHTTFLYKFCSCRQGILFYVLIFDIEKAKNNKKKKEKWKCKSFKQVTESLFCLFYDCISNHSRIHNINISIWICWYYVVKKKSKSSVVTTCS